MFLKQPFILSFQTIGQGLVPCDESILYKIGITENRMEVKPHDVIDYTVVISTNSDSNFNKDFYVELQQFQICASCYLRWELAEGDWNLRYGQRK